MLKGTSGVTIPALTKEQISAIELFADLIKIKDMTYLQVLQYFFQNKEIYDLFKKFFGNTKYDSGATMEIQSEKKTTTTTSSTIASMDTEVSVSIDTPSITKKRVEIDVEEKKSVKSWGDMVSDEENDEEVQNPWVQVARKKVSTPSTATTPSNVIVPYNPSVVNNITWSDVMKKIDEIKKNLIAVTIQKFKNNGVGINNINQTFEGDDPMTTYKTVYCRNIENHGNCHFGSKCTYAHNENEQLYIGYVAAIYKTLVYMMQYKVHDIGYAKGVIEFLEYIQTVVPIWE
jgi:hypothetical protein